MTDHPNGSVAGGAETPAEEQELPVDAPEPSEADNGTEAGTLEDTLGDTDSDPRFAELEQQAARWQDRYLRAVADMENLKRRHRQEMEEARRFGNEQLLGSLVSVLDNLQRALEAAENGENFAALRDGVSLTQKQLLEVLGKSGLAPIEAVGQPYDPTLHEAIGHVEAPNGEAPDTVIEEIQRGYTLHGRLLRPSLVRIAG
jgi:molecular chaperone GrpE